jgi:spermidine/putrescine transport system substrate-binding protein
MPTVRNYTSHSGGTGLRRRDALKLAGLAGLAGTGLAAAGCGSDTATTATRLQADSGTTSFWARQRNTRHVNFANWPLYIDTGPHSSLAEFTASTGITVTYAQVIQDDPSWFNAISPIIRRGEYIGYDVMVVTDGFQFSELVTLGELTPLDQSLMPNFYHYAGKTYQHRSFDPGNTYSMPWQSGSTGIAWNPTYIKEPVTSLNDLWNPAYKGHVGMMSDVQDTGNFGMLKLGIEPVGSTAADWRAAAKVLTQQRDAGLVRGYYQQSYLQALAAGDTWISMAWSGDIFQQNLSGGTQLKFVVPSEGGNLWTDNMMIPKYAQNPVAAMMLMDWYYKPPIAAQLTEAVNYISPVPAVQPIVAADAAKAKGAQRQLLHEVATSSLVWPTPAEYARLHNYADISGKKQQEYISIFQPVVSA